jgi:hypothetical protein
MDNDALEQETTTPQAHDRGEITGKALTVSEDEATSEAQIRGRIEWNFEYRKPESES